MVQGPAWQGCTWAAAAVPHLCLILRLLELLLSETLAHEFGHTKATQGASFRVTGKRLERWEGRGGGGVQTPPREKEGIEKERPKLKRGYRYALIRKSVIHPI